MDMNIRFDNKVTLITGGSAGIGLAAAELFGSLGAKVAICGTNPDKLARAAAELRDKGITVYSQTCNVSDSDALASFAAGTEAALGPIDIWVSNAAIYPQYAIIDTDEALWNKTMATNVNSVYAGARIAFRSMKDRGGVMLVASSFAALFPSVGGGAYAVSKSAVSSLIRTLAAELAPYGIRVNGYVPGVIDTDINHERILRDGDSLKTAIALQTFGTPMDVAWSMAFLASDYARYITGATLEISGGKMGVQNPARAWEDKETRG